MTAHFPDLVQELQSKVGEGGKLVLRVIIITDMD